MSEEVNKRLFAHYTNLSNGNYKSGNSVQDELVASDAKKHLSRFNKEKSILLLKSRKLLRKLRKLRNLNLRVRNNGREC